MFGAKPYKEPLQKSEDIIYSLSFALNEYSV